MRRNAGKNSLGVGHLRETQLQPQSGVFTVITEDIKIVQENFQLVQAGVAHGCDAFR